MADTPELPPEPTPQRPRGGAPPGTKKAKPLLILAIVLLAGAAVALVSWLRTRGYETTDDAFVEGHVIQVSPRISAQVLEVRTHDNAEVRKGDLLVRLDGRDLEVGLEKAQAQLLQAQAMVQQARAQAQQAEAQAAQQSAQFDIANINFNRNASLYQQDLRAVSRQEVDTTRASMQAAQATLDAARASVQAAQSQVGSAEAAVHVAQAAVDDATLQLSYTRIVAPESGRITRKTVEPGNYLTAGQTLFSIVGHDVWVTANFKETQLAHMKQGQPVSVRVDAYPGRELRAHVDSFQAGSGSRFSVLPAENATGNYVKVVQRVPVKILLDEPEDVLINLGLGMSVEPRVRIGG